jgi:hypothetical protein
MWLSSGFRRLVNAVESLDGEAEMPYRKAVELQESLAAAKQSLDHQPSYDDLLKCVEMLAAIQPDNVPWWFTDCHDMAVKLTSRK